MGESDVDQFIQGGEPPGRAVEGAEGIGPHRARPGQGPGPPLPSRELLRSADQLLERAAYDFVRGEENFEAEQFQQALGFFDGSVDAYEDICRKLVDGHLTAAADARVEAAQAREAGLREAGAPDSARSIAG